MHDSLRVFVSATTADLGPCREALAAVLRKAQIFPVIQEELPANSATLREALTECIASCDAVVCLVGKVFGAKPAEQVGSLCSYTQMEYLSARDLGKPIFVFLAHGAFVSPKEVDEPPEWQASQERHRAQLLEAHKCEWFRNIDDLRLQAAELIPRLLDLVVQPMYFLHPPERPAFFTGRSFEFRQLDAALRQRSPSILAVVGMGGQGKTTVISEFLRVQRGLRHSAGFWCTAYRASFTFDMFLDEALDYLSRSSFVKRNNLDTQTRIRRLMEFLQARRALIVIDGIERWLLGWMQDDLPAGHPPVADPRASGHEGLDEFLRQASGLANGTHVILTTRSMPSALDRVSVTLVPVYPEDQEPRLRGIDVEAAVELLRRHRVNGTDSQLADIATRWNCHPLTLSVLAGLLFKRYGGNVERLPALNVFDPRLPLNSLLDETRRHLPAAAQADRIMMAASLAEENPSAALLASGLEALSPNEAMSEDEVLDSVVALSEWQLMEWNGERGYAVVHPLVQKYFETLLKPDERLAIHGAFAEFYSREQPPEFPANLADVRPRILAIIHHCRAANVDGAESLLFGEFQRGLAFLDWLSGSGHHVTAIELVGRLLSLTDDRKKGRMMTVRGALRMELGDFAAALVDLDAAILILEAQAAEGDPEAAFDLAGALINRGNAKGEQSDRNALADFDRALATLAGLAGLTWMVAVEWLTAQVRLNRSSHLFDRGRLSEALSDITTSIDKCRLFARDDPGGVNPVLATALSNRGLLYVDYGRHQDAIIELNEACDLYASLIKSGRTDLRAKFAHIRATRAVALDEAGFGAEALVHFDESIGDLQSLADEGRDDVELNLALALMNRCFCHLGQNNLSLSVQDGERALALFRRRTRSDRRARGYAGHTLLNLAEAYFRLGRPADSLDAHSQGLALGKEVCLEGMASQAIFFRKAVRAAAYWAETDHAVAVPLMDRAIDLVETALADDEEKEGLTIEVRRTWANTVPICSRFDASAEGRRALGRLKNLAARCGVLGNSVGTHGRTGRHPA